MQLTYYLALFVMSVLLTLLYAFRWRKQNETHMTAVFIVIPIANLAYLLMYAAHEPVSAAALTKVTYAVGCILPWFVTMCELNLCQLEVPRWVRISTLVASLATYATVLSIGYADIFYRSLTVGQVGEAWVLSKEYGPAHMLHYVVVTLYLIADLAVLIYCRRKERQVSRIILFLLFLPLLVTSLAYFAGHSLSVPGFEMPPLTYVLAQVVYLFIARRMGYYNLGEMVIESVAQAGDTGLITVDNEERYLGSNETARRILPELNQLMVDQDVWEVEALRKTLTHWLMVFQSAGCEWILYTRPGSGEAGDTDERIYKVRVGYLYDGRTRCGLQVFIQDDTANQRYVRLLDQYNNDLQADVAAKTERIVAMHDQLVLGMATMVESRDNSTGGHIRRTSEGVRILVGEMRGDDELRLTDKFCRNIIKAAPMHDLGKIAVDDAILRKPGRFTPEEFEKMKSHAAEGARIVHEILRDTDDEEFRLIAENVAHYHHERMDGSGYPDGLRGDEIPLEARIMAIADVYDALVSKRVYKDAFSFEEADRIILEGMGTQFDARLERYYRAARLKLEAYYAAEQSRDTRG